MERLTRVLESNHSYFADDTMLQHDEYGFSGDVVNKFC